MLRNCPIFMQYQAVLVQLPSAALLHFCSMRPKIGPPIGPDELARFMLHEK
jgi:hypothetical protein